MTNAIDDLEFNIFFNTVKDPIAILDLQSNFIRFNDTYLEMTGFTKEELLAKSCIGLSAPEDVERSVQAIAVVIEKGFIKEYEKSCITKSGEYIRVSMTMSLMPDKRHFLISTRDMTQRRKQEKLIQDSELRFRQLFENMNSGVIVYEPVDGGKDFIFKDFNRAVERIEKIKREEFVGKTVMESFPYLGDMEFFTVLQRVYTTQIAETFSIHYDKDNKIAGWKDSYVYKLPTGEIVVIYDDITEKKQIEEGLKDSEARLKNLLETSPIAIRMAKSDGHEVVFANKAYSQLLNAKMEDIFGKNPRSYYVNEAVYDDIVSRLLNNEEISNVVIELNIPNHGTKWALASYSIVIFENIQCVLGWFYDITAQENTKIELEKSKDKLNEAQAISHLGSWELDLLSGQLEWSDGIYNIFEIDKSHFVATYEAFLGAIHPEDREMVNLAYTNSLETKQKYEITHRLLMPDGRVKYVQEQCRTHFDESGKPFRSMGTVQDITELKTLELNLQALVSDEIEKRLEKERLLAQQSKLAMMGEMIGNIAHQWRQPLNLLAATVQDIPVAFKYGEVNEAYLKEFKDDSMKTIQYMSHTIDDFRNFFKPDKERVEFCAKDSVNKAYALARDGLKYSFVDTELALPDYEAVIFGFPNEFAQVLLNLLNNSKDALIEKREADRKVKIEVKKDDKNNIVVTVQDNAGGIPEDIIERIFEPYFTTKHKSQGTGLGLYMSKMIIEQNMGGRLSVHNTDEGACFEITLSAYQN